jgi:uncharacterized protein YkwD
MRKTLFVCIIIACLSFQKNPAIVIDKKEAQKAYKLLNDIRTNPSKYYSEFDFLKTSAITNKKLVWNDTLAKVAEQKAFDMAKRDYFKHVDPDGRGINYYTKKSKYSLLPNWTKDQKANNFESIVAGSENGEEAIKILIIDEGEPTLGHRKHLLGINKWNAALKDIGIGYVKSDAGSKYPTYVSIVIAMHSN